ncbi:hypothetical protein [Nonomuraea sp. NEAU-A123]|uniref:hypothetical protein n=1 Tax=Nonomuraea sp. NEAU-A123 TaxID=2839649 RepID=UPI001BE42E65|nr:hypothetical protein [Nonomuraea sp. NEAU-A123]MBT2232988.1 hypothetical protein [Nonomuraea sp. NEAU-A123]
MSEHFVVRIYESELAVITDETLDHHELETGGSLFGLFGHGGGPTVFLATRPAGEVQKRQTSLELDPQVTRALEQVAWDGFGVQCIGMWHSHHWIGLMEPSSGDRERTRRYAQKYHRPQYTEILANFVSRETSHSRRGRGRPGSDYRVQLTPFFYLDARNLTRAETFFHVLPGESPLRGTLAKLVGGLVERPSLSTAMRPASRLPEDSYRLAGSAASAVSGWRRFVSGVRSDSGDVDDHRADESPEASDAKPAAEELAGSSAVFEKRPDDPERPRAERPREAADLPEAPAKPSQPSHSSQSSGGRIPLLPIPDLPDFVTQYIEPAVQPLAGRYDVEVKVIHADRIAVIVRIPGRATRLLLFAAWDGERAVTADCRVAVVRGNSHEVVEWRTRQRAEMYDLRAPLKWGVLLLEKLP